MLIKDCINNLQMVAISEGAGSGTKLFQSLLDSHPNVLMIPGYALMYFYPFWERKIQHRKQLGWPEILQNIISSFPSLFDTRKQAGSEGLDQLGASKTESLIVSEKDFCHTFLAITENESISSKAALIAVHVAYAVSAGEDLTRKTVLVYHIHVFFYVEKYLRRDFPDLKVIASVRDPRANIARRVENSVLKPNEQKLRDSDFFLMRHSAYFHIMRFTCEGLDSLANVPEQKIRVFRHEDLVTKLKHVMYSTAKFIDISFDEVLLKPTWGGLQWHTTYYNFDSTKYIANPDVISSDWQKLHSEQEILFIEGLCWGVVTKYYGHPYVFNAAKFTHLVALILLSVMPRSYELKELGKLIRIDKYLSIVAKELKNLNTLKSYQGNLFYELKWTNGGIDFSRRDLLSNIDVLSRTGRAVVLSAYAVERLWRYVTIFPAFLLNYFWRVKISISAIWKGLKRQRILPDTL